MNGGGQYGMPQQMGGMQPYGMQPWRQMGMQQFGMRPNYGGAYNMGGQGFGNQSFGGYQGFGGQGFGGYQGFPMFGGFNPMFSQMMPNYGGYQPPAATVSSSPRVLEGTGGVRPPNPAQATTDMYDSLSALNPYGRDGGM